MSAETSLDAADTPADRRRRHLGPTRRRATQRNPAATVAMFALLTIGAAFVLLPLVWMVSTAFKEPKDAFAIPPHFLSRVTLQNFDGLITGAFGSYLTHSAIIAVLTTTIALVLGIPAGYAFARSNVPGARLINMWFVLAYVAPPVVFILPLYIIYQHLHLLDTYLGLILAYETGLLPFTVWLTRTYFADVPRELDEAAWIDGCSKLGALWRVVLPTVLPGITTVGLLVALSSWGEYFGAVILTGPNTETAPVAVNSYVGLLSADWSKLAAAGVIVIIPALVATIFVQRGFARGITVGAVKQ